MKTLNVIAILIIAATFLPGVCTYQVDPAQVGVRRSIEGGVAEEDFSVGKHFSVPLVHSWYELPATLRYLEFNASDGSAIDVRTSENNVIYMDITVPYRIREGEAWKMVRDGLSPSYEEKVRTTALSVLPKELASLSTEQVQDPDERVKAAQKALPVLNAALAPYHVEASHVVIRAFRFRDQLERQLQNKQLFAVEGKLDAAQKDESIAKQQTETVEKRIGKDVALKREEWNQKIENLKAKVALEIAQIEADALVYDKSKRAEADAKYAELRAEGRLAQAKAEALGDKLRAEILATSAGRTFSAIEAVRRFKLGDVLLNSYDPDFLQRFGSMSAWRRFFLGEK